MPSHFDRVVSWPEKKESNHIKPLIYPGASQKSLGYPGMQALYKVDRD